jgi:3D (Asp-Asp-Asp) domain-containing protein
MSIPTLTIALLASSFPLLPFATTQAKEEAAPAPKETRKVRTTAYSHGEADHKAYGNKNAIGTPLKYGRVRSAAADWSRFPLGTKFRLKGDPNTLYVIDDYGRALVGKETIDLYKPTLSAMRRWGARNVEIEILEWGCLKKSLKILKPRAKYASHVKRMVWAIQDQI